MKIATFNINNVNKRLRQLLAWLRSGAPGRGLPPGAEGGGFGVSAGRRSRRPDTARSGAARNHGTAWRSSRADREPILTHTALPGDPADAQSRYIAAAVNGVLIASLYAPNGNPQPGPKFAYKLAWMKRLRGARRGALRGRPAGRARRRLQRRADGQRYLCDAGRTRTTRWCSRSRAACSRRILAQGWVDAIRALHPDATIYTFWDYMRNRWERDAGLRLDHLLLSAAGGGAPGRSGRRPRCPRAGACERSCAGLGRCCGTRPGA